jgi:hypothetical protein
MSTATTLPMIGPTIVIDHVAVGLITVAALLP